MGWSDMVAAGKLLKNSSPWPFGVQTANMGTAIVDFGTGNSAAFVTVTGCAGITAGAPVRAWKMADTSDDHNADEHRIEEIDLLCGDVVAGQGFTIWATARNGSATGKYIVHWQWS